MSEAILRGKIKPALSTNAFLLGSVCNKKKGEILGMNLPLLAVHIILYFNLMRCKGIAN